MRTSLDRVLLHDPSWRPLLALCLVLLCPSATPVITLSGWLS